MQVRFAEEAEERRSGGEEEEEIKMNKNGNKKYKKREYQGISSGLLH